MASTSRMSWHQWLVTRTYNSFGQTDVPSFDRFAYAMVVAASALFIACAAIICAVLNAGSLLFGIAVEPVWTGRERLRVLMLPGGIRLVLVVMPVLVIYGIWRTTVSYGLVVTLAPFILTVVMGFGLLGAIVLFNTVRRRMLQGPR